MTNIRKKFEIKKKTTEVSKRVRLLDQHKPGNTELSNSGVPKNTSKGVVRIHRTERIERTKPKTDEERVNTAAQPSKKEKKKLPHHKSDRSKALTTNINYTQLSSLESILTVTQPTYQIQDKLTRIINLNGKPNRKYKKNTDQTSNKRYTNKAINESIPPSTKVVLIRSKVNKHNVVTLIDFYVILDNSGEPNKCCLKYSLRHDPKHNIKSNRSHLTSTYTLTVDIPSYHRLSSLSSYESILSNIPAYYSLSKPKRSKFLLSSLLPYYVLDQISTSISNEPFFNDNEYSSISSFEYIISQVGHFRPLQTTEDRDIIFPLLASVYSHTSYIQGRPVPLSSFFLCSSSASSVPEPTLESNIPDEYKSDTTDPSNPSYNNPISEESDTTLVTTHAPIVRRSKRVLTPTSTSTSTSNKAPVILPGYSTTDLSYLYTAPVDISSSKNTTTNLNINNHSTSNLITHKNKDRNVSTPLNKISSNKNPTSYTNTSYDVSNDYFTAYPLSLFSISKRSGRNTLFKLRAFKFRNFDRMRIKTDLVKSWINLNYEMNMSYLQSYASITHQDAPYADICDNLFSSELLLDNHLNKMLISTGLLLILTSPDVETILELLPQLPEQYKAEYTNWLNTDVQLNNTTNRISWPKRKSTEYIKCREYVLNTYRFDIQFPWEVYQEITHLRRNFFINWETRKALFALERDTFNKLNRETNNAKRLEVLEKQHGVLDEIRKSANSRISKLTQSMRSSVLEETNKKFTLKKQ